MWELDYKESWAPKNWCFWIVVLEKTLESPLDCKEIQPVHSKGDQSWVFIGRTDVEAETPILRPPDVKSWLIWKDSDAGGEGGNRGWDGWMASLTQWVWVWVDSGSWWWIGRPGMLRFMVSQRVRPDWVTELNWTYIMEWLHVQIFRTAVWYMLTHNSNKNWRCSMSSFLVILKFLLLKQFLGDLVLRQENEHTHRELNEQLRLHTAWPSPHLPAQFTPGSSWCYALEPSSWLCQATLCHHSII